MSKLVSIVVTVNDGTQDRTFNVDTETNCVLVWKDSGWDLLADYYKHVKKDHKKEKEVRDRTCPEAKPKPGAGGRAELIAAPMGGTPVIGLKSPDCDPTQWP
jgi:hypothetical protein